LHHGPHAHHGGADGAADHGGLADRRVHDPHRPEAVEEAGGDAEGAAVGADVLAEHEHPLVRFHLVPQGLADGFQVGHGLGGLGGHQALTSSYTPSNALSGGGMGEARAKSTSSLSWASILATISLSSSSFARPPPSRWRSKRSIGSFGRHSSNCSLGT